jgi:hypothetical protein
MPVVVFSIMESRSAFEKAEQMKAVLVPKSSGEDKLLKNIEKMLHPPH